MDPPGEDKFELVEAKPVFAGPNAGGPPTDEGRGEEQVDERLLLLLRLTRSSSGRRGSRLTRSLGLW